MFRKSWVIFVLSIFIVSSLVSMDAHAKEKSRKHRHPFKAIWVKIFDHEERITDLEEKSPVVGVKVYDASGQYLGVLMNFDAWDEGGANVFIPSIGIIARISLGNGDLKERYIYFDDSNCTGVPYSKALYTYILFKNGSKYY